jgi:hypothetical protein
MGSQPRRLCHVKQQDDVPGYPFYLMFVCEWLKNCSLLSTQFYVSKVKLSLALVIKHYAKKRHEEVCIEIHAI